MLDHLEIGLEAVATLFFALVILHALADFALQNEFIALSKVPGADLSCFFGTENQPKGVWIYSLAAHSLLHGGGVWLITGSPLFGLVEFFLHAVIDLLKSKEKINFHSDQLCHLTCKLAYAIIIGSGMV